MFLDFGEVFVNTWFLLSWRNSVFKSCSEFDAPHIKKAKTLCCIGIHSLFSSNQCFWILLRVFMPSWYHLSWRSSVCKCCSEIDAPQIKGSKIFWFIRIQRVISLRAVFSGFWWWFLSIPDFTCLDGVQFVKVAQYLLHHIWRKLKLFVSLESNHYFAPISVFWIFVSALWILWFHMSLCVDICFG